MGKRVTKVSAHTTEVWKVVFEADAYPQVETALIMSPLRSEEIYVDYVVRNRKRAMDILSFVAFSKYPSLDSFIQLYYDVPEEAQWIPILEELFKCDSSSS